MSGMSEVLSRIPGPRHRSATATPFVVLDRSRCEACWCCVEACPETVLGKVESFRHRHAVVEAGERCTGCGRCVKACKSGAFTSGDG
jgi:2-oxoglutarate ferredoxin oxidoreductase subunit delta